MAGLLQSLRRAFGGPEERPAAARRTDHDEEYGPPFDPDVLGWDTGTAVVDREREADADLGKVDDGVYVKPTPITAGQAVTIWYAGLLSRHGADQVFLHYGFGPGQWQQVGDLPMQRVGYIGGAPLWEARVVVDRFGTFEFCFRDSAENWDNNNGHNWVYQIHWGQ